MQQVVKHDPRPRSLDLDEVPDPKRTHVCRACQMEGDAEEMHEGECSQPPLFGDAA